MQDIQNIQIGRFGHPRVRRAAACAVVWLAVLAAPFVGRATPSQLPPGAVDAASSADATDGACHIPEDGDNPSKAARAAADRALADALRPVVAGRYAERMAFALEALAVSEQAALERLAFDAALRATRECLARENPEPFCDAVVHGRPESCSLMAETGGLVHPGACVFLAALVQAQTSHQVAACDATADLAPFCRALWAPGPVNCAPFGAPNGSPVGAVCAAVRDPDRCRVLGDDWRDACAMGALLRALRGEYYLCEGMDEARYPRLVATCRALRDDSVGRCLGATTESPALGRCVTGQPWAPAVEHVGQNLRVRAAVANVLRIPADCTLTPTARDVDGAPVPLRPVSLGRIGPGQARTAQVRVVVPPGVTAAAAEVACVWDPAARRVQAHLQAWAGPSRESVTLPRPDVPPVADDESGTQE